MTIGVGGSTIEQALAKLDNMTQQVAPISNDELNARLQKAQSLMQQQGIAAMYIDAGTNLTYFTGLKWYKSERLVGAILPAKGELCYVAPHFEQGSLNDYMKLNGEFFGWHEHQSPYALIAEILQKHEINEGKLAVDPSAGYFLVDGIIKANPQLTVINADVITAPCRECKSDAEIALMQTAKNMTLEVHKAAASILKPGINTSEVEAFINQAHKKVGASGSSFCIVLFGLATSFPHGVKDPQVLQENDWVLIDTGCIVEGYHSDITRTYAYGEATDEQRAVWQVEKDAQIAAFNAAKIGQACEVTDAAARVVIDAAGFGPEYELPGLPHRTGHGCGMDIHESPYLVKGDTTPIAKGMVFSNEPMLVLPGKFGVRLEDHFYMTDEGPKWFTQPAHSVDDPFGLA
ncbi:Xaa-Pro peptidase family protein [Pseudoalteromonas sp. MMG024]|uniref:M24 family metallopeptidase n=1 Tax=Pseudoalteromonas sp. MMG024 TaxID=2909980 RepID=UPI001F3813C1|nr:Xaa-Pro peptidase family protein [Pseudoalteromonas sp. MMG024]MCF6456737.1 Xaa-Pro peptidase family protein [Pseudoalteromonas sp. MMG024]